MFELSFLVVMQSDRQGTEPVCTEAMPSDLNISHVNDQ